MIIPLLEGTHYDEKAIKNLVNAGWDEQLANSLITSLFKKHDGQEPKIHAFVHSGVNWLEKYLVGIARMYDEQTGGDAEKVKEFEEQSTPIFDQFLMWVRENRDKIGGSLYDAEFNQKMSYKDVEDKLAEIQADLKKKNDEEMSKLKFGSSNYKLVPIESYEQMHKLFGNGKTGDGTDKEGEYAGSPRGGTAWCHTNNKGTYDSWVNGNKNKFYVLQRNNYEDIPFDADEIRQKHGYGEYGESLMAILADKYGNLKKVTLRGNHVGNPSKPDNMYETYAELSKIAGFNVEEEIKKYSEEPRPEDEFFIFDEEDGAILEGIRKATERMIVPDFVKTIGTNAFGNLENLKEVVLPEGLESINCWAFEGCKSLEKINFPDSLDYIGNNAFTGCENLKEIKLPPLITTVYEGTFQGCIRLRKADITGNCAHIRDGAFMKCPELSDVEFPPYLESIGENAFRESAITKLFLPSIDRIKYSAFKDCKELKEVRIDQKCDFASCVFSNCVSLEKVYLNDAIAYIPWGTFMDCVNLKEINIPKYCFEIGEYAFARCRNLNTVTFPDGLKNIGSKSFEGTPLLKHNEGCDIVNDIVIAYKGDEEHLVIPEGVVKLSSEVFSKTKIKSVSLPKSLKIIGDDCFYDCNFLETVNFSEGLEIIGVGAFDNCKSLKEVSLPENARLYDDAFEYCRSLTNVKLPSNLPEIPENCFKMCRNLKQINIPDSVHTIKMNAFCKSGLTSVNIPHSVKYIKDEAFEACRDLTEVTLNEGLIGIGAYCFGGCDKLKEISIPDSVEMIEEYAFFGCSALSKVEIYNVELGNGVFEGTPYDDINPISNLAEEGYNRTKLDL